MPDARADRAVVGGRGGTREPLEREAHLDNGSLAIGHGDDTTAPRAVSLEAANGLTMDETERVRAPCGGCARGRKYSPLRASQLRS